MAVAQGSKQDIQLSAKQLKSQLKNQLRNNRRKAMKVKERQAQIENFKTTPAVGEAQRYSADLSQSLGARSAVWESTGSQFLDDDILAGIEASRACSQPLSPAEQEQANIAKAMKNSAEEDAIRVREAERSALEEAEAVKAATEASVLEIRWQRCESSGARLDGASTSSPRTKSNPGGWVVVDGFYTSMATMHAQEAQGASPQISLEQQPPAFALQEQTATAPAAATVAIPMAAPVAVQVTAAVTEGAVKPTKDGTKPNKRTRRANKRAAQSQGVSQAPSQEQQLPSPAAIQAPSSPEEEEQQAERAMAVTADAAHLAQKELEADAALIELVQRRSKLQQAEKDPELAVAVAASLFLPNSSQGSRGGKGKGANEQCSQPTTSVPRDQGASQARPKQRQQQQSSEAAIQAPSSPEEEEQHMRRAVAASLESSGQKGKVKGAKNGKGQKKPSNGKGKKKRGKAK